MKRFLLLGVSLAALLAIRVEAAEPQGAAKGDAGKLIGEYQIISGERGGQKIDAARVDAVRVRIAAGKITTLDSAQKEVYVAKYQLDTRQKPWRITMTATVTPDKSKGTQAEGLIQLEGDTVKLIYALPGGSTPTHFKTADKQQMFVLKRAVL